MTELFTRHSTVAYTGPVVGAETGKPTAYVSHKCGRCGGAGGSERWRHTGWTCYECGGTGEGKIAAVRLYTAAEIAKLDATAAKKAAKKAEAAEAARVAHEAEVAARYETFRAAHGALLAKAKGYVERSSFIASMVEVAERTNALSDARLAALKSAIAKIEASDAAKAASAWVGKEGERLTLTVVAERVTAIPTRFGTMYVAAMRTPEGHAVVTKGSFVPPGVTWDEDGRATVEAAPFTLRGTVKEHGEFRGEKNTVLARAAVVEAAA